MNSSAGPQGETEINREMEKLQSITGKLEDLNQILITRLEKVLRNGGLSGESDNAKNPENSSQFGQELNTVNGRLDKVVVSLSGILDRLEI